MLELVGLVVVVLLVAWSVVAHNGLLAWRTRVRKSWTVLEGRLQRRRDVAVDLAEAVRSGGEDPDLTHAAARVRTAAEAGADGIAQRGAAETALSGALRELRTAAEGAAGPPAGESAGGSARGSAGRPAGGSAGRPGADSGGSTVGRLTAELDGTENLIADAQQSYNETVDRYEARRRRPGSSLIAGITHFGPAERFDAATDSRTPV